MVLMLALVACTPHPTLAEAERLFDTDYDSACALLRSIEPQHLRSRADRALYALSVTRGRFYRGMPDANDSLITIATAYYDHRDTHRAALAWFYRAKTVALTERYDEQIAALLKAQHYSIKEGNHRLLAYIYLERASLFDHQRQPDSALHNYRRALQAFAAQHDTLNAVNTEMQMACLYSRLKDYAKAESICRRLLQHEARLPVAYRSALHRMMGSISHSRGHYLLAAQAYGQTPRTSDPAYDDNLSYLIAKSYCASGQYDSAEHHLRTIVNYKAMAPDYHKLWAALHQHRGNYPSATASMEKAMAATDSLYRHRIDQSFAGLEKQFNYQQLKLKNQKLEINHFRVKLLVLICFIGIAALAALFYVYRNKAKMRHLEMDKELLEQKNLRIEKEMENTKLHERQLELQQHILINLEHYRKNVFKNPEFIKERLSPAKNDHFFIVLTTAIDLEYSSISLRLRQSFEKLSDTDLITCCLLLAGFDTGTIASILDIKIESMILKRSRLRKKLNLDSSKNLLNFLRNF